MTTLNTSCLRSIALACAMAALVSLSACDGNDNAASSTTPATPATTQAQAPAGEYPLDVCVVSGDKLGAMGDPIVITHEGREVRFCCAGCVPKFKAEPAKYLAMLDAAQSGKPTDEHAGHDH